MSRGVPSLLVWCAFGLTLAFLYAPLLPPVLNAFEVAQGAHPLAHFAAVFEDDRLLRAVRVSLVAGALTALIAPTLAFLAAEAIRVWRMPGPIIFVLLIPMFVPAVAMGLGTGLFFQVLGVPPSLLTITAVQVVWALPFALLIVLTTLAGFAPVQLEAAHLAGANRLQAFLEVELPQIRPGLVGAALFSFILSLNETIRTAVVQGGNNTVPTYLWAQYQQIGLSPPLFALMTLLVGLTLLLLAVLAVVDRSAPEP